MHYDQLRVQQTGLILVSSVNTKDSLDSLLDLVDGRLRFGIIDSVEFECRLPSGKTDYLPLQFSEVFFESLHFRFQFRDLILCETICEYRRQTITCRQYLIQVQAVMIMCFRVVL